MHFSVLASLIAEFCALAPLIYISCLRPDGSTIKLRVHVYLTDSFILPSNNMAQQPIILSKNANLAITHL
jgi:hypothetical protein